MSDDNELTDNFNNPLPGPKKSQEPASKQKIDELYKQLSEPRLVYDRTPMGSVTRQVRSDHDQHILKEIEEIRSRLERRRNNARDDFNRAHDGPNHGWK